MIAGVFLDAGPLGVATAPTISPESAGCKRWAFALRDAGTRVVVPDIVDYEVRRELIRAGKIRSLRRLDEFEAEFEYLEIGPKALRLAAELWAEIRRVGLPTADDKAIDGDVILAAQILSLELNPDDYVVATSNPAHIARFVPAKRWQEITIGDE